MNPLHKSPLYLAFLFILMMMGVPKVEAQCPMCKAAVTSNSNDGKGVNGKGSPLADSLNSAILYLFVLPYMSIMLLAFVVYRSYKKRKKKMEAEADGKNPEIVDLAGGQMTE